MIDTRTLAEHIEARGEDVTDLAFLEMFYRTPATRDAIGAPAGCYNIEILDELTANYIKAAPQCYLSYVDDNGREFFTLKNRSRQTLAPALHSLWVETLCNEDGDEETA